MSLFLFTDGEMPIMGSDSVVIKARDRQNFEEADRLLAEVRELRAKQQQAFDAAKQDGLAQGLAQAEAQISEQLTDQLSAFAETIECVETARRKDIAEAAIAGVRSIIGELPDEKTVQKIMDHSLVAFDAEKVSAIHLHPDICAKLQDAGWDHAIELVPNAELAPTDCHIYTASSKLIADLSVQLNRLAERWGASNADSDDRAEPA